ncbi:MAG: 3-hydroxyacyl-ACP dehydratase FabZ [Pseudomonadota bacterium]
MNQEEVKKIIPHRDPFLFIDEMIALEPGVSGTAIKNVTGEEYFFQGHFPGNPVMPGVLIVEACAQVGAVVALSLPQFKGKTPLFAGIDEVKFKRMVKPGDQLVLECVIKRVIQTAGIGTIKATVNGEIACVGTIKFVAV